jgi:hypothetical protein
MNSPEAHPSGRAHVREVEVVTVVAVVLIVWTLVAFVALVFVRVLCAVAARADADHAGRMTRPVAAPQGGASSTSNPLPVGPVASVHTLRAGDAMDGTRRRVLRQAAGTAGDVA